MIFESSKVWGYWLHLRHLAQSKSLFFFVFSKVKRSFFSVFCSITLSKQQMCSNKLNKFKKLLRAKRFFSFFYQPFAYTFIHSAIAAFIKYNEKLLSFGIWCLLALSIILQRGCDIRFYPHQQIWIELSKKIIQKLEETNDKINFNFIPLIWALEFLVTMQQDVSDALMNRMSQQFKLLAAIILRYCYQILASPTS